MKNEKKTDHDLLNFIGNEKSYQYQWEMQKTKNAFIQGILNGSSKKNTGNNGLPDLIYVNKDEKLLILVENKASVRDHVSQNQNSPIGYAVDGIKHYLSFFTKSNIKKQKPSVQDFFEDWKYIGIAFSGDIHSEYGHLLDTFRINDDVITKIDANRILDEKDYLSFFENINFEKIADEISKASIEINTLLRSLDSQKRPVLLSALMICLYPNTEANDFIKNYSSRSAEKNIRSIPHAVSDILRHEGVEADKIEVLLNELTFMKTDSDLNDDDKNILKDILNTLHDHVIPLLKQKTSYDIIGKFYEEFLRYAGVANVKKGIVLTPNHITTLFTELIDIEIGIDIEDVIFDPACGTGAFLIAGMNKLNDIIKKSKLPDEKKRLENIKTNQLIGFEMSNTMYSLAISNMLFRGDGKSQIYNEDFFSDKASDILSKLDKKPTIGFINPPFGGKDNKKNFTKKEIQFLERMLDSCSKCGIIIAPLSTYIKEEAIRKRILSKHTLKYVINMPNDLFQPNASAHTAIAVFKTNRPHGNSKVVFYDLKDDGLVLSKHKGRTDVLNKWGDIKKDILNKINHPPKDPTINLVHKEVKPSDEWIIQAHAKTDYSKLTTQSFESSIKDYVIFSTKMKRNLMDADLDELTLLEILNDGGITSRAILEDSE